MLETILSAMVNKRSILKLSGKKLKIGAKRAVFSYLLLIINSEGFEEVLVLTETSLRLGALLCLPIDSCDTARVRKSDLGTETRINN